MTTLPGLEVETEHHGRALSGQHGLGHMPWPGAVGPAREGCPRREEVSPGRSGTVKDTAARGTVWASAQLPTPRDDAGARTQHACDKRQAAGHQQPALPC